MRDQKNLASPSSPVGRLDSQGKITVDLTIPYGELKLTQVLGEGAYGTVYKGQSASEKDQCRLS